jgi:membrane protein implicated in regulation of membrane protease activity
VVEITPRDPLQGETAMLLIVYYLIFMIAGDFAAYFIGLLVELEWGSHVSLIVFLALYFLSLWVAWLLSVRMTKPKVATQSAS